ELGVDAFKLWILWLHLYRPSSAHNGWLNVFYITNTERSRNPSRQLCTKSIVSSLCISWHLQFKNHGFEPSSHAVSALIPVCRNAITYPNLQSFSSSLYLPPSLLVCANSPNELCKGKKVSIHLTYNRQTTMKRGKPST